MTTIKFLTYNTHLFLGTFVGKFQPMKYTYEDEHRRDAIVRQLVAQDPPFDIIALNEVWGERQKRHIADAMSAHGYRAVHFECWQNQMPHAVSAPVLLEAFELAAKVKFGERIDPPDNGLLLLSRVGVPEIRKFTEYANFDRDVLKANTTLEHALDHIQKGMWEKLFQDIFSVETLSRKGIMEVMVRVPSESRTGASIPCYLFITHNRALGADFDVLQGAVEDLRKSGEYQADQGPILVYGDMNADALADPSKVKPSHAQYQRDIVKKMGSAHLYDAFRRIHPDPAKDPGCTVDPTKNELFKHFWPNQIGHHPQRIDYFLADDDYTNYDSSSMEPISGSWKLEANQLDLSDHYPLWATLAVKVGRTG